MTTFDLWLGRLPAAVFGCGVDMGRWGELVGGGASPGRVDSLADLATAVLTKAEDAAWRGLPGDERRRRHWLFGRLAAKAAVQSLAGLAWDARLELPQIEVLAGRLGGPEVTLPADADSRQRRAHVSISHSADLAVAAACAAPGVRGIGIDAERVRPSRAFEGRGFNVVERADVEALHPRHQLEIGVRYWCAKEAVSKALGTGLAPLGGARALTVERLDERGDSLRVHLSPGAAEVRFLDCVTVLHDDVVVATALHLGAPGHAEAGRTSTPD